MHEEIKMMRIADPALDLEWEDEIAQAVKCGDAQTLLNIFIKDKYCLSGNFAKKCLEDVLNDIPECEFEKRAEYITVENTIQKYVEMQNCDRESAEQTESNASFYLFNDEEEPDDQNESKLLISEHREMSYN